VQAVVEATKQKFGRIDVLVNNAGYGYLAAIEEGDDADIRAMFETNFFGLAATTRAVLPVMRAQKSGAIVNISSMGGFIGFPGSGYYAATKFAVEGLSEALSKEVAPFGIKVLIVEPGPFRTDWAGTFAEDAQAPDRRVRRDGDRAPAPDPGLQRRATRRPGPRRRGDHRNGRAERSAAQAPARQFRL
jgi:NAD(P)-dependent dehydrogenase (short-subunit alcohol dehydrogenase family)